MTTKLVMDAIFCERFMVGILCEFVCVCVAQHHLSLHIFFLLLDFKMVFLWPAPHRDALGC